MEDLEERHRQVHGGGESLATLPGLEVCQAKTQQRQDQEQSQDSQDFQGQDQLEDSQDSPEVCD